MYGHVQATRQELEEAFKKFDKNNDGHISSAELKEVLQTSGQNPTDEFVQEMLKSVDKDNSGTIELDEFCAYMEEKLSGSASTSKEAMKRKLFKVSFITSCLETSPGSSLHSPLSFPGNELNRIHALPVQTCIPWNGTAVTGMESICMTAILPA